MRSHGCGDLRADHAGQDVQLCGWVDRRRDHGGVIFIDLRDRTAVEEAGVEGARRRVAVPAGDQVSTVLLSL